MTKCASPRCSGRGSAVNRFGICNACLDPVEYDTPGARIESGFDQTREQQDQLDTAMERPDRD